MRFFFLIRYRAAETLSRFRVRLNVVNVVNVVKFQEEEKIDTKTFIGSRVNFDTRANQMNTMHIKITPDDNHLTFMPAVMPVPFSHIAVDITDVKATRERERTRGKRRRHTYL